MPKTSEFDAIYQQLDALSLDELQLVRAKVDALIAEKLSQAQQDNWESIQKGASLLTEDLEILRALADEGQKSVKILKEFAFRRLLASLESQISVSEALKTFREYTVFAKQRKDLREEDRLLSASGIEQIVDEEKSKLSLEEDDSLERIIELVDEWMSDDSGYDETVLPEIKAGLDQNRFNPRNW
ncbi:MAG: hypothetical protein SAK29_42560 [Scytonema sp. PMC 1069.18]|nr:hypothetical protein [Scytonema sp. PMC 1069.18]MEC4885209.1 hypothetical protein [Scytonema sp. PMC 1070.18]